METPVPANSVGKQRLEALTEGIYAIALTLLVLELKLPPLPHGATNAQLTQALLDVAPKASTWLLSFWVMVTFWLGQVRVYRLTVALSWGLVWVELLHLALVSLVPFSTALLGEHGNLPAAAFIYAANLFAVAVVSAMRTALLLKQPALHTPDLTHEVRHKLKVRGWILLGCTFAALALAIPFPGWNMFAMLPTALLPRLARL